jgi:hypothetical protein
MGRDSRWTALIAVSRSLFWWNPFVHHLAKSWAASREEVCDLHAEAAERSGYADFLIRLAARCQGSHILAASMASGARRRLQKRLVSFLNAPETLNLRVGRRFIATLAIALPLLALCSSCVRIGEKKEQASTASTGMPPLLLESGRDAKRKGPNLFVKLSNQVLAMPKPLSVGGAALAKNGTVLTPDQLQKLMGEAASTRGATLMTFPAISIRNGEKGVIEEIREKPPVPGEEKTTAGWELHQTIRYAGRSLRLGNQIRYAFVPGKQFSFSSQVAGGNEAPFSKSDWNKLVVTTASSEAKVPEGHSVVTALGEVPPGLRTILITTVIPIDATGREVHRYRDAIYTVKEPDPLPGQVQVNATLLSGSSLESLDEDSEYYRGVLGIRIMGIFTPEQWQTIRRGLKTENLGSKRLATDSPQQPWKQLPELQLEAHRYKDGEILVSLDLSVRESGDGRSGLFARQSLNISKKGSTVIYRLPSFDGESPRHLAITVEAVE